MSHFICQRAKSTLSLLFPTSPVSYLKCSCNFRIDLAGKMFVSLFVAWWMACLATGASGERISIAQRLCYICIALRNVLDSSTEMFLA